MKTSVKIKFAQIISRLLIFCLRQNKFTVTKNKINWNLNLNEAIDLAIFLFGRFEPSIFKTIKKLSNYNCDYIDIGANCGAHTMYMAKEFQNSRIFAIEPSEYSFKKLKSNLKINPKINKNIYLFQSFVNYKKTKPTSVYSSWELNSSRSKHKLHQGVKKSIQSASVISLDELVEKFNIKNSIIKCDVDGNELFVFKSAAKYLKKYKPKIIMELAPYLYKEQGYDSNTLFNFFKKFRYKFFDVTTNKEIKDIQNFSDSISSGESKNIFLI